MQWMEPRGLAGSGEAGDDEIGAQKGSRRPVWLACGETSMKVGIERSLDEGRIACGGTELPALRWCEWPEVPRMKYDEVRSTNMRRKSGRHESRSIVPLTAEGVLLISNRGTGLDQSQFDGVSRQRGDEYK
ncbi:hypothetical protein H0G86_013130 [Trichoderma simmonsii]|uniref:Uncharacterized protein n=1 Tax=Trichoderma simmonsii TaxID=1491479 RepID=A0A8G0LQH4_9HYPO|nr:hypothetical protein H0G86_013130 [Trichoderma simmonsii]